MISRKTKRLMNEIKELEESKDILKESGIYFDYSEDNLDKINILFIGPEKTPYEKGFYFFDLTYPENYPMTPPVMKYNTQGCLVNKKQDLVKIRFNPNLYTNGKVCLSMLNTWKGPGWVPTNTITNILVAIQALVFNDEPLKNEPGFENSDQKMIDSYSKVINYANYKISIIDQLNSKNLGKFSVFKNEMINYFKENIEIYDNLIKILCHESESIKKDEEVTTPAYGMNVYLHYNFLLECYESLKKKLMKEEKCSESLCNFSDIKEKEKDNV